MKKAFLWLLIVLALAFLFTGCKGEDPYITEDEAKASVMAKGGNGTVDQIALGSIDGFKVYCGLFNDGVNVYEFQVDAESGAVVNWINPNETIAVAMEMPVPKTAAIEPSEGIKLSEEQFIDAAKAQEAANAKYPDAIIESVDLVDGEDVFIYQVKITHDQEKLTVFVDAKTGQIIEK